MAFCFINLINFATALVIQINSSQPLMESSLSLVVIALGGVIYILTLVLFFCDTKSFDYFYTSFKPSKLCSFQYPLYFITIVGTSLCLCLLPMVPWAPLILPGLLLIWTLVIRPYKECRENVRSIFVLVAILLVLGLRILLLLSLNKLLCFIYFCVSLLFVAALGVFTLVALIYELVTMCRGGSS